MDSNTLPTSSIQSLRALDPDIPLLAAEVSIDIDNLLAGRSEDRTAMQRLATILSESIVTDQSNQPIRSRMDIATLFLLSGAVMESFKEEQHKTTEDFLNKAKKIAFILKEGDPQQDMDELRQTSDFCEALSRATASFIESFRDLPPSHPFRR